MLRDDLKVAEQDQVPIRVPVVLNHSTYMDSLGERCIAVAQIRSVS